MARAVQIVDYVKTTIQDDPLRRKEIALDSHTRPGSYSLAAAVSL